MDDFREFDSVELLAPVSGADASTFPIGTRAAIVDLSSGYALVEVIEEDGASHGPYDVALTDLRLIEHAHVT